MQVNVAIGDFSPLMQSTRQSCDGKKVQDFDPDKYKSMQYIFQLFLEPGQSIDTIRRKMFELGLTTPPGRMLVKN